MKLLLLASLAALCLVLFPGRAMANVDCPLNSQATVDMGSSSYGVGTIPYTCNSYNTTATAVTLCLALNGASASYPGTLAQPVMLGPNQARLPFVPYINPSATIPWDANTPLTKDVTLPGGNGNAVPVNGTFNVYAMFPSRGSSPVGVYTAYYYNVALGVMSGGTCQPYPNGFSGRQFTLMLTATVTASCTVAVSGDVDLGAVSGLAGNVTGFTTITPTCPNGTIFSIGLLPSNGNKNGSGILSGATTGNADHPPYQLRSSSSSGPIWGDTGTVADAGNGVSGVGTGSAQSFRAYVTMGNLNFHPDTYSDTVTINLRY